MRDRKSTPPHRKVREIARRGFSIGALGALGTTILPQAPRAASPAKAAVTLDFSSWQAKRSMNGFLNSIQYPDAPADRIVPLRPRLWRSNDLRQHDAIKSWGAAFEGVLSDGWGYPIDGRWKSPTLNLAAWDEFVTRIANLTRGKELYWDLWNEPDTAGSWPESRDSLFALWIRTAKLLRQLLGPQTRIGGPSTSSFQPAYFDAFLSSCLQAGCPVDFLCWHELEPWSDIAVVEKNLRHARSRYVDDPRFKSLNLTEIHLNEYVGQVDQYRPAELLAFLYYLERGGADYAARSCWGRHCEDNSIDGIIEPVSRRPRSQWWVHAHYATGCERRVPATSDFGHLVVMGYQPTAGPGSSHAMMGYYGHEGATAASVKVEVRASGLSQVIKGGRVAIKAFQIPDAGARPLDTLPLVLDQKAQTAQDQVEFSVNIRLHEVCVLRLEEAN